MAHLILWEKPKLQILDLEYFVVSVQRDARLRDKPGLNVYVGNHVPPAGGPNIVHDLQEILLNAESKTHPYKVHCQYETLHPFTDGNGRSGRALWAWQMLNQGWGFGIDFGFLHAFYYQTLQHSNR